MQRIDLHTHSTTSDGTDSPAELMVKARQIGLAAIALTDHDTMKGLAEAKAKAKELDIEFIRGCEISTRTDDGSMHILGLWLPEYYEPLESYLKNLRDGRKRRNDLILEKLANHGIHLTMKEVREQAKGAIGRPHIASLMLKKGYVQNLHEAFDLWLGETGKAYAPKPVPQAEEAVKILSKSGASPILAHPLLHEHSPEWLDSFVRRLKPLGLFGLEAWHSSHSPEQSEQIIKLAQKYDLAISGGSDYHGENKPDIQLGSGRNGNVQVPASVLDKLRQKRLSLGLEVQV